MSIPRYKILPLTSATPSFIRFKERKKVDFPDPEAPIKEVILYLSNCKFPSNKACFSP